MAPSVNLKIVAAYSLTTFYFTASMGGGFRFGRRLLLLQVGLYHNSLGNCWNAVDNRHHSQQ